MKGYSSNIKGCLQRFQERKGYFTGDDKTLRFFHGNGTNTDLENVILKIAALNNHVVTQNNLELTIARHIISINPDPRLTNGDTSVVNELVPVDIRQEFQCYSFATRYCSWHFPNLYPVYDELIEQTVSEYFKLSKGTVPDHDQFLEYSTFSQLIDEFIKDLHIDLDYLELDKFNWLYADQFFK